jgi:phosphotransferase system HPr (HPr) family protein
MSKAICRTVVVSSPQGLHARPADMLVRMANQFQSTITLGRGGESVDCKSILSLLTLGATQGTELFLKAEGDDAESAVDLIEQFFLRGFDELADDDAQPTDSVSETDSTSTS